MASDSAGSKYSGCDSVEYRVVRSHFGPLVKLSQHVLCPLANELFSRPLNGPQQFISQLELTNAINGNQPSYDRASKVMNSVLTKVEGNSLLFPEFVLALRESGLNGIANDLDEALREEKGLCPTMPPIGIPQGVVTSLDTKAAFLTAVSKNTVTSMQATYCYTFQTPGPTASSEQEINLPVSSSTNAMPFLEDNSQNSGSIPSPIGSSIANDSSTDLQPTESLSAPIPSKSNSYEGEDGAVQGVQTTWSPTASSFVLPSYSTPQFNTTVDQPSLRQLSSAWRGQSLFKSSPVAGDEFEICVQPMQPLARNPLIDALSSPIHSSIKLVHVQKSTTQHALGHAATLHTPHEEGGSSSTRFPIQSTYNEEDMLDTSEADSYHMSSAPNAHKFIKHGSFQSSCFCHVRIRVLRLKLDHRMSEIQILKNEIKELERSFEEERKRMSETLQEQTQLNAQREKVIKILEDDIAFRDALVKQLNKEKADYEREIGELQKCCKNAKEMQWIAEQRAVFAAEKSAATVKENQEKCTRLEKCLHDTQDKLEERDRKLKEVEQRYQDKIARLEKELEESERRAVEHKHEYFNINSETLRSEAVANVEAHIAEKNQIARSILVPKLKQQAEREGKKAASKNDFDTAKEAEELARKAERLLCITKPTNQPAKKQISESASEKRQEE